MSDTSRASANGHGAGNPAFDRLKEELQHYLEARAQHAVSGLGDRLHDRLTGRNSGGPDGGGGLAPLAKGGKVLAEGGSSARAALSVGTSALKEKAKGLFGGGGGKGRSGGGKSKKVTIVEDIDVGVPVRTAYDQWTQFQEFSTFAKGVVSVERADDVSTDWKVKVAKSTRSWKANVTEQVPDERISWTTEGAKGTVKGVVTFHPLGDNLTRVLLVLEYFPKGFVEKTGNIWRAAGRRARLDLKLYRTFVTTRGEATDGWRGEIRDGEVVRDHESAVEAEEAEEHERDDEPAGAHETREAHEERDENPEHPEHPEHDDEFTDDEPEDEPADDEETYAEDEDEYEHQDEYEDQDDGEYEDGEPEDDRRRPAVPSRR